MDRDDVQAFLQEIQGEIPGFGLAYKDESLLMKILGILISPFNPEFMTRFTTTWGTRVFFPNRTRVGEDSLWAFSILAHEFVHLMDDQKHGFLGFKGTYVLPQMLAVLPLAVFGVMGGWPALLALMVGYLLAATTYKVFPSPKPILFWVSFVPLALVSLVWGWLLVKWWLLLVPAALCFLFLPSPWRTKWELRGYTMTIAVQWWLYKRGPSEVRYESLLKNFVGSDYLFMSRDRAGISKALRSATESAKSGALLSEKPYRLVYDFLKERGLLV